MSVYIIYAREDHAAARRMAAHLESAAIPAAFDIKQYSEGSGLRARVEKQIREASLVVFVMTPAAAASAYCLDELDHSARLGKHIVAAISAPLPPDFVPPSTAIAETIHLYDDPSIAGSGFGSSMAQIAELLRANPADRSRASRKPILLDMARSHTFNEHDPIRPFDFDSKAYVFLSYPYKIDPNLLRAVVRSLLRRRVSVWMYDPAPCRLTEEEARGVSSLKNGGDWRVEIQDAIDSSSASLLLVGQRSHEQEIEIEHAMAKGRCHAARIDDVPDSQIPKKLLDGLVPSLNFKTRAPDLIAAAVEKLADRVAEDVFGDEFKPVRKQTSHFASIAQQWFVAAHKFWVTSWPAVIRQLPLVLTGLLSAALFLHLILQPSSLFFVSLLSLAIVAVAAWRFWMEMRKDRAPFGTVWARSRLAWASLALLIPLSVGFTLHRQSHDGPARLLAHLDAPVSAVAAGRGADGEHLFAIATYGGELHIGNPDNRASLRSLQISEGTERPVIRLLVQGDQALGIAPAIIAVREDEVMSWTGEGEPVTIWSGDGVPLVALDEGQRLVIVETRPLRRGDTRYAALSRVWDQSAENRGLSFDMAMSLTGRLANFTFAISLADPLAGATEAVHFQQAPILPTALAIGGQGAEARVMIGGSEGELLVCTQGGDGGALATQAGAPYIECPAAVPSGSSSSISAITLEGDTATTQHRDGAVVAWTRVDNTWTPGEPGQFAPVVASKPGRLRLTGSDVELAAFRDHVPETAMLPDGRIVAGGWDGRVMIVDPEAAGAMARANPAAWIASLWAPVSDTARTMFANIPGLGSSNPWERLSSADRAIAIDRNPRAVTDVWFAVGSVIAMPRESITEPVLEPDAANDSASRSRLDLDRAVSARDRTSSALEDLGLSGTVTPSESGTVTTTIGTNPTRQRQQVQSQSAEERAWSYAAETNTLRSYSDYLAKYPNGFWAAEANAAIAELSAQANDPPAQVNDDPVQTPRPQPQTNPLRQQTIAAPEQTTPPATQVAASVMRRRALGSADISPVFAVETELACPAGVSIAQLQGDPMLATACVLDQLRQSGEYEYVELDYIARPAQAAAALGVSAVMRDQWALGNGAGGANLSSVGWTTPVAADAALGVVVAIIDTGIAREHPSVAGAAWLAPGYDMVSDPLMGNDGDGRDNDPADAGDRCNTEDPRATDSLHGTHVAGLVAAAGAPGVKIVPVRALGRCGGKLSDINDAIRWAAGTIPARDIQGVEVWNSQPADIINLSFEFPVACPTSLQAAIDDAVAAGAVVVAAAGNGGRDAAMWSPGGCRNVVSVGASDARGAPAAYSNFGNGITLYAPGGDLSRDDNGDGVKDGVVSWGEGGVRCVDALTGEVRRECRHVMTAGTSNAAALATAALAILKAENNAATQSELLAQLTASTRESCVAHPNPRSRRACISWTGGPVRVLGVGPEQAKEPADSAAAVPPRSLPNVPKRSITTSGLMLIKRMEGVSLCQPATAENLHCPYDDTNDYCSIGHGYLIAKASCERLIPQLTETGYIDGISQAEADKLLLADLSRAQLALERLLDDSGKLGLVELTDYQYDALVSFIFNVGFSTFQQSTLLRALRERTEISGDARVAEQIRRWSRANGVAVQGLQNRREAEVEHFFTGFAVPAAEALSNDEPVVPPAKISSPN